ncbi:hypothetical protein H9P43_004611 [Blastocladiella emersonii ATCC 22665]|nr:hypothetical protein H9P43_004611 [Blastocladiella emersonii ATCC 22665]
MRFSTSEHLPNALDCATACTKSRECRFAALQVVDAKQFACTLATVPDVRSQLMPAAVPTEACHLPKYGSVIPSSSVTDQYVPCDPPRHLFRPSRVADSASLIECRDECAKAASCVAANYLKKSAKCQILDLPGVPRASLSDQVLPHAIVVWPSNATVSDVPGAVSLQQAMIEQRVKLSRATVTKMQNFDGPTSLGGARIYVVRGASAAVLDLTAEWRIDVAPFPVTDRWNPYTNQTKSEWPAAYRSAAPDAEGKWTNLLGNSAANEAVRWVPLVQPTNAAELNETVVLRGYPLAKGGNASEVIRLGRANSSDTSSAVNVTSKTRVASTLEAAIDWASVSMSTTSYSAAVNATTYILDNKSDLYSMDTTGNLTLLTPATSIVPPPRSHGALAALTNTTLILVGGTNGTSTVLGDVWMFDLRSRIWSPTRSGLIEPRAFHQIAVYNSGSRDKAPSGEYDCQFVIVYGGASVVSSAAPSTPLQPLAMEAIMTYPGWYPSRQIDTVPKLATTTPPVLALYRGGGGGVSGTSLAVFSSPAPGAVNSNNTALPFMMFWPSIPLGTNRTQLDVVPAKRGWGGSLHHFDPNPPGERWNMDGIGWLIALTIFVLLGGAAAAGFLCFGCMKMSYKENQRAQATHRAKLEEAQAKATAPLAATSDGAAANAGSDEAV